MFVVSERGETRLAAVHHVITLLGWTAQLTKAQSKRNPIPVESFDSNFYWENCCLLNERHLVEHLSSLCQWQMQ